MHRGRDHRNGRRSRDGRRLCHYRGSPGADPSTTTQSDAQRKTLAARRQAGYLLAGNRTVARDETVAQQRPVPCRCRDGWVAHDPRQPDAAPRVGKEFTYKIEVTNRTFTVHDVAITVTLPENLLPVALGTTPGDATIDGREVRFPPLANLFGGEPRAYYVRVLPQKPGDAKVQAQLTQRGSSRPILVDTVTQILP